MGHRSDDTDLLAPCDRLRIDAACLDFEKRWKTGPPPDIADFCRVVDSLVSRVLFEELLLLDLDYRRKRGETPEPAAYLGRFAGTESVVTAVFRETLSAPTPLPPPPELPGYVLGERLGAGGMGVVYRAWHGALKRPVAIKMLRSGAGATPAEQARFRAEAEAVARLSHPNIVRIFDVGSHDGQLFLALEFAPNGTLSQRLADTPYGPLDAARLLLVLARAVVYAHAKAIVHRDLKPANILLAEDDRPMIADFGLARDIDAGLDHTTTQEVVGTPGYLAPEQVRGGPAARAPTVDLHALGAILYQLLTGRPPFHGPTTYDTLRMVLEHEPAPPRRLQPHLPVDLETICLKCLVKSPDRRYRSADELSDDLERFLAGRPIRARRPSTFEQLRRWTRRNPAVAALSLGLAVAVVVGLTGWYRLTAGLAQAQRDTATQRDRALANLRSAREAVSVFLREATNDSTFKEHSSPQSRQRMLWLARQFYDEMPTGDDDPQVLRERIMTLIDLSRLTELLGDTPESISLVRRAAELAERLPQDHAERQSALEQLAATRNELGQVLVKTDRLDDAQIEYQAAIALAESLLLTSKNREKSLFHLGAMHNNLGVLFRKKNLLADARRCHLRALELREQLPQHIGDYANAVAQSWHNLGSVHQSAGDASEAARHYVEAVNRRQTIVDGHPEYAEYSMNLVSSLQSLGAVRRGQGLYAQARECFVRALAVSDAVIARYPGVAGYEAARQRTLREIDRTEKAATAP